MNKRTVGADKENLACDFLEERGVKVLCTNFNTRHGEIDIIGKDNENLVFFEVKYRRDGRFGYPLEAVTKTKQRNIVNAARYYMYKERVAQDIPIRFDCIGILGNEIEWVKNAF